jgi:hypothetical protein
MRTKAPLATLALASALSGCAGSQARPADPGPVIVVGDVAVAPKGKNATDADGTAPQLAQQKAIEEAGEAGIIGVLTGKEEGNIDRVLGGSSGDEGSVMLSGPVGVGGGVGGVVSGFGKGGGIGVGRIGLLHQGSGAGSAFGYGGLGVRGGRRAKVRFDDATVTGPLPAEAVQRVADDHRQDVEDCYLLEAAREADPRGRVTLAISIDGGGSVTEVRVPETTLWTRDVPSCIAQAIGAWKFPAPAQGDEVKVILPVNL